MKLLWSLILMSIIGCTASPDMNIKNVYEKRAEIVSTFTKESVFRKRMGDYIFLHTYNGDKRNEYVFSMKADTVFLLRDSLLFSPDSILGINQNGQDSSVYKEQLIDRLRLYLKKMDSLKISDISSEFFKQGIDLKIYMESKGVLAYVSDSRNVVNDEWVKYLNSMQKLGENWYYTMNE